MCVGSTNWQRNGLSSDDSHTLILAVDHPTRLPERTQKLILDHANVRLASAATYWEKAIRFSLG